MPGVEEDVLDAEPVVVDLSSPDDASRLVPVDNGPRPEDGAQNLPQDPGSVVL